MATSAELKLLAKERVAEAAVLHSNGHYPGCYYLAGYGVELSLKAVICRRLNVEMYNGSITNDVAKLFKIHKIDHLIILAGLQSDLARDKNNDPSLSVAWTFIVDWSEHSRYEIGCIEQKAKDLLKSVNIFLIWIEQHW